MREKRAALPYHHHGAAVANETAPLLAEADRVGGRSCEMASRTLRRFILATAVFLLVGLLSATLLLEDPSVHNPANLVSFDKVQINLGGDGASADAGEDFAGQPNASRLNVLQPNASRFFYGDRPPGVNLVDAEKLPSSLLDSQITYIHVHMR